MTNNLRKKNSRHRASWTHGHGEKKKRRGAGSRGGRGNAGSGKRGDAKKPSFWKNTKTFGKFGFTNPTTKKLNTISIAQLNTSVDQFVAKGFATKKDATYTINLTAAGFDKLLGTGSPVFTYQVTIASTTAKAQEKIAAKKGQVMTNDVAKEAPNAVVDE